MSNLQGDYLYDLRGSHAAATSDPCKWFFISPSSEPVYDREGELIGYKCLHRDHAERHTYHEQLWALSNLDALTGLPNRKRFKTTLEEAVRKAAIRQDIFAVVIVDIDNFTAINAAFGQAEGDNVLKLVAQRLTEVLGATDYIGRFDGDEFALILQGVGAAKDLLPRLETLMRSVESARENAPFSNITISLGAAIYPVDASESTELISDADIALRRAKDNGRSQYVQFQAEYKKAVDRRASAQRCIDEALNKETLLLHYQPVVDPVTQRVLSLEALLRWKDPDGKIVSAYHFQEVFDLMTMAARIGKYVTNHAIQQGVEWNREGVEFGKIAINVTSADFVLGDFPSWLSTRLKYYGLDPSQICIEVTEGMFLGSSAESVNKGLLALNAIGTEIAFDDFGTGYASLTHLCLPIDRLKIDRSFVQNIESDPTSVAIVQAIVQLGDSLNKAITVEGVETEQQAKILLDLGCRQFQGYLYSKALPAEQIPDLISRFGGRQRGPVRENCVVSF
jgi:diguanylate cyclase (GGDEF)-like protein